jgi:inner membrane protein
MPTVLTHAAVPLAVGLGLGPSVISRRLLVAGVVASMLPDLDTLGFRLGVPYGSPFGHRGFAHSLAVACGFALVALAAHGWLRASRWTAFWFVLLAMASHGLLDTLTTGGRGVALLWPFSDARYFAPWRVIRVSPIGVGRFMHGQVWQVMRSELLWVWVPMLVVFCVLRLGRKARSL